MQVLIRKVERKGAGSVAHQDTPITTDIITIGRGANEVIFIPDRRIALEHATIIHQPDGSLLIKSKTSAGIIVNGTLKHAAEFNIGDIVSFGDYELKYAENIEGYEAVFELEKLKTASDEVGSHYVMNLRDAGLNKRRWSWIGFLGVLLIGLAIPMWGFFDPIISAHTRASSLPDDSLWDSGPLHPSHRFIGNDCHACHQKPFEMVQDKTCLTCHTDISHHVDIDKFHLEPLERRCGSCHKEHNEPEMLTRIDQKMCADCHQDMSKITTQNVDLRDASDFEKHHPNFKLSLLAYNEQSNDWQLKRMLPDGKPKEASNLIFPHDKHLDTEGVDGPDGKVVLACSDCHAEDAGGMSFESINMEAHCESCHSLSFDEDKPERKVPHETPEVINIALQEFFSLAYLEDKKKAPKAIEGQRDARRPGTLTKEEKAKALAWAKTQSKEVMAELIEKRVCVDCHKITEHPEREIPWDVMPVKLNPVWYTLAKFDHKPHETQSCTSCHKAETSESAEDILIPNIDNCQACHGGEHASNKLSSTCITCHEFHIGGKGLMSEANEHFNPASTKP